MSADKRQNYCILLIENKDAALLVLHSTPAGIRLYDFHLFPE